MKPAKIHGRSIDLSAAPSGYAWEEEIILDFDPAQIDGEDMKIQAVAPDGRIAKSEFNMSNLKYVVCLSFWRPPELC